MLLVREVHVRDFDVADIHRNPCTGGHSGRTTYKLLLQEFIREKKY
jgi:hypothetical protein